MFVGLWCELASTGGSFEESDLEEVGFGEFFYGAAVF